ncbi:hypothetical protein AcW1_010023 [Taiwanofungus camphoratus]|nr:hypothetical protein AcV5_003146 [Antrodia cinnamomea]KAI0946594.1 hypothetical protein AcW1_010023 [Antrodia cinnamomea]
MDSDVVASQLEHRTELLIPPGSSTEGTSGDEVLETPIVQSPSTFSDSGTEGTNQSRGPELSLDEFVKRRSLIIHAVHVHGIHKLMDGQYPGLQIEIQMDGWAGRRSEVVCSENPIWKLNKVLTDVDASSIVTIILYRRVSHKERSVDLILATAQQPVAQLSWLPTYLSYVADSGPSTSNQISLVLGCTMRPLLNDNIVKEFTSEYNVLAEQAKTEFVLPPEIEGSPVTLLRTIFSSPERGRFLGRFHKPRLCIEFLDQFLIMMNPDDRLYRTVLHSLRRLCAKYASLPTSFRVSHKKLTKHERVTGGGFGDVYKGQHKNRDVCLKTMAKNRASSFDMSQALKVVCREAIAWKYLDHRNIIMLLGVNVSLISDNLCLISPWMEHGDIRAYLKNNPATNRLQLLVDIACGLEYLHSLDLVHADLKGANVLIDDEKRALLTDFGLATVAYELNTVNSTSSISKGGGTVR